MCEDPEHWTHEHDEQRMERYHDMTPERDRPTPAELAEDAKHLDEMSRRAAAETAADHAQPERSTRTNYPQGA